MFSNNVYYWMQVGSLDYIPVRTVDASSIITSLGIDLVEFESIPILDECGNHIIDCNGYRIYT